MKDDLSEADPKDILSAETQLKFEDAAGIDEAVGDVRIKIKKKAEKSTNWEEITDHAENFCGSVLSFAVNPVVNGEPRYQEGEELITIQSGDEKGSISIVGPAEEFMGRKVAAIEEQIDHIERLMFKDWVDIDHPTIVEKRFESEEEASRTMHLLQTMALAFGIQEKIVKTSFHGSDDDLTIRMNKQFLKTLIEREQTLEASIAL
jgi:hypothetical protein